MPRSIPIAATDRERLLQRLRHKKMASSAHAFVRGSTEKFYEWLLSSNARALPRGPEIWICGDCHLGNLGPIADQNGQVGIQIRDLDQTVIGSPAHDVIRLALSLAMATRSAGRPGGIVAAVIEGVVRGYEGALESLAEGGKPIVSGEGGRVPGVLGIVYRRAMRRSWSALFDERLGMEERRFPIGKRFWPLTDEERAELHKLVLREDVRRLITSQYTRDDEADVSLVDSAFWVKGCSSLGGWRSAVLVNVQPRSRKRKKREDPDRTLALLDVREALPACSPRSEARGIPAHNGERVAMGAGALSPFLGERMIPGRLLGRDLILRELMPQDLKFELNELSDTEATTVACHLAGVVGRAHARQLTPESVREWLNTFRRGHAHQLEAPVWLWKSIVELVAVHEGAYLDFCRLTRRGSTDDPNPKITPPHVQIR